MRKEAERCRMAFEEAEKGRDVAMVCSGDAGIYGMAGLICEIGKRVSGIGHRGSSRHYGGVRRCCGTGSSADA